MIFSSYMLQLARPILIQGNSAVIGSRTIAVKSLPVPVCYFHAAW